MSRFVYAYSCGGDALDVSDRGNGGKARVQATHVKVDRWRKNNRMTHYWFTWRGVRYYGRCGEDRTGFKPRALKG